MDNDRTTDERDDELTVPEAADYLYLMIPRVMALCEAGTFGHPIATPTGTDWLIRRADLDTLNRSTHIRRSHSSRRPARAITWQSCAKPTS